MYIPAAAAAAVRWDDAARKLAKDLGREPTENEIRVALGYGPIVGEAELSYLYGAGGSVPLGPSHRLSFDGIRDGRMKVRLEELPSKEAI